MTEPRRAGRVPSTVLTELKVPHWSLEFRHGCDDHVIDHRPGAGKCCAGGDFEQMKRPLKNLPEDDKRGEDGECWNDSFRSCLSRPFPLSLSIVSLFTIGILASIGKRTCYEQRPSPDMRRPESIGHQACVDLGRG